MKLKKKLPMLALVTLLGISIGALTGCEKDDRTQVVFWHTLGKNNQELLNKMIVAFEAENPDIHINHAQQGGYPDIESKIIKAIPAKTTPTMAICYPDHVANYIDSKAAVKLNDLINDPEIGFTADELADYEAAGFWAEGSTSYDKEGSVYSVPYAKSTEVIFYNYTWFKKNLPQALDENGMLKVTKWESDDPTDVSAMFNVCKMIKDINNSLTPLGYDSDDNMYITLSEQYGIPYTSLNDNGKGSLDFNNAEAKDLVKRLKGYYDKGYFVTKGVLPNSTYTSTKFKNQELVMSIGSTGGTSYNFPNQSNGEYEFDARVAPIPQAGTVEKVISQGPSITFFKNAKISDEQLKASWKFYKFITNTSNSAAYSAATGYEPVRKSSYSDKAYTDRYNDAKAATGDLYARVANVIKTYYAANDAHPTSSYFSSAVFVGSSAARKHCGGIITEIFLDANKEYTKNPDSYINTAFDAAEEAIAFQMPAD